MKNQLYFALVCLAALSCNQQENTGQDEKKEAEALKPECYAFRTTKDSALLHIEFADELVTGKLSYYIYEKDRNTGTIAGEMSGDTLVAVYTFQSEGVESRREVAFLRSGDNWMEGYGAVRDSAGTQMFENRGALKFSEALLFKPEPCAAE